MSANRMSVKSAVSLVVSIFFSLYLSFSSGLAGTNLPQKRIEVTIKGKQHVQLAKYFEALQEKPDELDKKIEQTLSSVMPKIYRDACRTMISKWGPGARRTASTVMRVIYFRRASEHHQDVLVAYTCYSTAKQFGDRVYDERLALLSVDSSSSTLRTIPHGKPCNGCSELTRIGSGEDTLQIDGQPAMSIVFQTSHNNPCCADSSAREEVTHHFYKLERGDLVEMVVLPFHRLEIDPKSPADTTVYNSRTSHETDASGNIVKIMSDYEVTRTQQPTLQGVVVYLWNKKSHRFEQIPN